MNRYSRFLLAVRNLEIEHGIWLESTEALNVQDEPPKYDDQYNSGGVLSAARTLSEFHELLEAFSSPEQHLRMTATRCLDSGLPPDLESELKIALELVSKK